MVSQDKISVMSSLEEYTDGSVQGCSNSIANALELLQSCTQPSTLYAIANSSLSDSLHSQLVAYVGSTAQISLVQMDQFEHYIV